MNDPSTEIRVGALGCGNRLRGILQMLTQHNPGIRVMAAYDPYPPSIDHLERTVRSPITRHDNRGGLVEDDEVDWIAIGSPNRFHAEQTVAALEAGKHVFCEKPLAIDFDSCLRVRGAVQQSQCHFAFGLVLRYSPHYQAIQRLCDARRIGRLISFEFNETLALAHGGYIFGNWRRSRSVAGTHILEKTCHDLDLANWIAGSLPVRVASFGGRRFFVPENAGIADLVQPATDGRSPFRAWDDPHGVNPFTGGADILDHQVAILEYANGVVATFHTNAAAMLPERRFYLCGTEGTLRADVMTGDLVLKRIDSPAESFDTGVSGGHGGGDGVMVERLAATMLEGAAPLAGIDEPLRSAIVAFGIDEAADLGRVVDLRPLWAKAGIDPSLVGADYLQAAL